MIENTNTKQFYPGPILNNTLEITDFLFNTAEQVKIKYSKLDENGILHDIDLTYPTDYEVNKVLPSDIDIAEAALTASTGQIIIKGLEILEGEKLTAYRVSPIIQDKDYPRTGAFPAATHEGALDYLTMQNQEQKDEIDRALKVPVSTQNFEGSLPLPIPSRALKINNEGTGFEMSEFDPDIALVTTEEFRNQALEAANQALEAANQAEIAVDETKIAADNVMQSIASGEQLLQDIIQTGQQIQSEIIDTGINTRATIDLDNITDKAKQAIQYQAKLANAPFCVNSGNVDEDGNADLLYLPSMGDLEIPWQSPIVTSANEYGSITWDRSDLLFLVNGKTDLVRIDGGTYTFTWEFPEDKRILINQIKVYWGAWNGVSANPDWAKLFLYKNGELVAEHQLTIQFVTDWITNTFEKTECDKIVFQFDGHYNPDVYSRIGEMQLSGTEIITVSTSTSCYFKVGGNYPKLVTTNTEKTFEKNYLQPVNIEDIDLLYRANYTMIGTLSDNDGLIKGFTTTNYAQIPMTIPFSIADNFEVATKFTYKESSATQQMILAEHSTAYYSGIGIGEGGYIILVLGNSAHTVRFIEAISTYTPIAEHSYNLKFTFDGTTYRVFIKEENDTEFEEIITQESTERLADFIWDIGCSATASYELPFAGVIDLKETYIKINGQTMWDNMGGTFNVFINDTQQPYALANTIYRQKTEPSPKFVQPILTANGTMGGASFAVSSDVAQYGSNAVYAAFDGNTSSTYGFHSISGTKTGYLDIYNPIALNITNFKIYNQNYANRASSSGIIYGSNDGADWTQITTYTNSVQTANGSWNIDLSSNTNYYKYYRIESTAGGSDSYWVIIEIQITATQAQNQGDVWLNTSIQPYKAYKFNGTEWVDFNDVPIGSMVVEGGIISSVETFEYNPINKEEIVSWNMPDYNAGISATGLYTSSNKFVAPCDGLFIYYCWCHAASSFYINDIKAGFIQGSANGYGQSYPIVLPLNKGDTYYQANATTNTTCMGMFYPYKGVL